MKLMITTDVMYKVMDICRAVERAGGKALLIGGCVRDSVLGVLSKDVDIEVYGVYPDHLMAVLGTVGDIDTVGQSFSVIKMKGYPIDVSVPRRDNKTGTGHKGFEVEADPFMSIADAARRRDFTMNAMSFDPIAQTVYDPFHGLTHLASKILEHVDGDTFAEDPLRVMRGMQFIARYQLKPSFKTVALCRSISPEGLSSERFLEEWDKFILKGVDMQAGLEFLEDTLWLRYFPELHAMRGCEQEPAFHPEGDVFNHTGLALDSFAVDRDFKGRLDEEDDRVVGYAVMCHDMGKPFCTEKDEEGIVRSRRHEQYGAIVAEQFLRRLTNSQDFIDQVKTLVREHMSTWHVYRSKASSVRRLANRVGRIDRLVRVFNADQLGRCAGSDKLKAGEWLLEKAAELEVEANKPKPIVMGRHLIDLGLEPGKEFGKILDYCFQAQLDGRFDTVEDGIEVAKEII